MAAYVPGKRLCMLTTWVVTLNATGVIGIP